MNTRSRWNRWELVGLAMLLVWGCGGEATEPLPLGEWVTLVEADWELSPGQESFRCARRTVQQDMYVQAFRDISPPGTHHTVLSMGDAIAPDGEFDCSGGTNHQSGLFGSGVGGEPFWLPDGVAVKVAAGQQVLLNLHLFNVGYEASHGRSGTEVYLVAADEVEHEAEVILAGSTTFAIPPSYAEHEEGGRCLFHEDATVFALSPHMHQLGVHMRVVHGDDVLLDDPYDFEEQWFRAIEPQRVHAGEGVDVHCTWVNDTGDVVGFGNSSTEEMCFVGLYRYPAANRGIVCAAPL
jgi:hypothetical protein